MRQPHAILLSAGQGRRLLPLTTEIPKCLLPAADGVPLLQLQLEALAANGVTSATVMVGFGAAHVETWLARNAVPDVRVRMHFNPFYAVSDNLATCWLASADMQRDFILLNGDTVFEPDVLRRALAASTGPVTLTIDRKPAYDDDDMKVTLAHDARLVAVGKNIPAGSVHGEAIGLSIFRGSGCVAFRAALDAAIRQPTALGRWYLDVIDVLAGSVPVKCVSIESLWWCEIDTPADLAAARAVIANRHGGERRAAPRPRTALRATSA